MRKLLLIFLTLFFIGNQKTLFGQKDNPQTKTGLSKTKEQKFVFIFSGIQKDSKKQEMIAAINFLDSTPIIFDMPSVKTIDGQYKVIKNSEYNHTVYTQDQNKSALVKKYKVEKIDFYISNDKSRLEVAITLKRPGDWIGTENLYKIFNSIATSIKNKCVEIN